MKRIFWLVVIICLGYGGYIMYQASQDGGKIVIKPGVLWNKLKDRIMDNDLPVKKMIDSVEIDMRDVSTKSNFLEKKGGKKPEYDKKDRMLLDRILKKAGD